MVLSPALNDRERLSHILDPIDGGDNKRVQIMSFGESSSLDSFGRLRTSHPVSIFDSTFEYDIHPLSWTTLTSGSGTVTHDSNRGSVKFSTTTASGDSAIFQTRQYFKYHPGKGQFVVFSGNIGLPKENSRRRIGQFDANNGFFFELDGLTASCVIRSNVSGSVVDNKISRDSWNVDKLDGNGASGVTLDLSKQLILFVDYQWLGSGRVRFGTIIDGHTYYAHIENHANVISTPYNRTGTLPLRAELTNTGATASATDTYLTCASIYSEGGWAPEGVIRSFGLTSSRAIPAATKYPVLSLRKASSTVNIPVRLMAASIFSDTADSLLVEFTVNATLTGSTFATSLGNCEIDSAATSMTGGNNIHSFYISSQANGISVIDVQDIFDAANVVIGSSLDGTSDIVTIAVTSLTGAASAATAITFKELI